MRLLFTTLLLLTITISFGQKKVVGLWLKEIQPANKNFLNDIFPKINDNDEIEFVLVDPNNYQANKSFDYLMNVTSNAIFDKTDFYDYEREEKKSVKGKDGKNQVVVKKVRYSGIHVKFDNTIAVRFMDVATQQYLDGFVYEADVAKGIADKSVHNILATSDKKLREVKKRALKKKYKTDLDRIRTNIYKSYFKDVVNAFMAETSRIVFEVPTITAIDKEKKGKAIKVKIKGSKYADGSNYRSMFYIKEKGDSLINIGSSYSYNGLLESIRVAKGKKEIYDAFQAKTNIMLIPLEKLYQYEHNSLLTKDVNVTTVLSRDKNTMKYALEKLFYNHTLSILPNVNVFEREDIPDLSKVLKSEDFLDSKKAFVNRDQLVGVDYLFTFDGKSYDIIEVKSGEIKSQVKWADVEVDRSIKGSIKAAKGIMKQIFKDRRGTETKVMTAMCEAVNMPTKVVKILEEKKAKAEQVLVQTMIPLGMNRTYEVYRIDIEKVGDKELKREVLIGEVVPSPVANTSCYVEAKVKDGKKDIYQAYNNSKTLILKHKKAGIFSSANHSVYVTEYKLELSSL